MGELRLAFGRRAIGNKRHDSQGASVGLVQVITQQHVQLRRVLAGDCPDFCISKNGTVPLRAVFGSHGIQSGSPTFAAALHSFSNRRVSSARRFGVSTPLTAMSRNAAAAPHNKAYSVAFQQPPSFVHDRIGCFPQLQASVDVPGKFVEPAPVVRRLLELPQLTIAIELDDELAGDFEELNIAALGTRSTARPLEQFDQASRLLIDMPRKKYKQRHRWICRCRPRGTGHWLSAWWNQFWLARRHDTLDQSSVCRRFTQVIARPRLGRINEALQLKIAIWVSRPDRAPLRRPRRKPAAPTEPG